MRSPCDNQWVVVEKVEATQEFQTVYNLRIADFHTYFVGAPEWGWDVWAHNKCGSADVNDAIAREDPRPPAEQSRTNHQYAKQLADAANRARPYGHEVGILRCPGYFSMTMTAATFTNARKLA